MVTEAAPDDSQRSTHVKGRPSLGILFVHGIGDQRRGQTLADFGTPLFNWLSGRAEQLGGSVTLSRARLTPEDNPAHAELRIERKGEERRWLLAETWWAESFGARSFSELANWSFSVIPWTFGSHFGRRLSRAWHSRRDGWRNSIRWLFNVMTAFGAMIAGLSMSLVMLGFFSVLLVISLIPLRRLRASIQGLQVRLESTMGDSLIFVNRPIESTAVITRFHDDLEWLIQQGCERLAVVAHSQGGAVAARGLSGGVPNQLKLLITFGSGLRKLEELIVLRRNRSLRRGAALTLLSWVIVACLVLLGVRAARDWRTLTSLSTSSVPEIASSIALILAYTVFGFYVLIAGFRDFVRGPTPPRVLAMGRFFESKGLTWKDFYSSADPVPNGRLHDDASIPPTSIEVVNRGSMLSDHNAYWANADEFVTLVSEALLTCDDPPVLPVIDADSIQYLRHQRRRRVQILLASGWIGLASTVLLLVRYSADWGKVLKWSVTKVADKIAGFFGGGLTVSEVPRANQWGRTLGWLALILVVHFVARRVWAANNRLETDNPPPYRYTGRLRLVLVEMLWVQLLVIGLAWLHGEMVPTWYFFLSMVPPAFGLGVRKPPWADEADDAKAPSQDQARAAADVAARKLGKVSEIFSKPFGLVLGAVLLTTWTQKFISKHLGYELNWILAAVVGAAVVAALVFVAVFVGMLLANLFQRRRSRIRQTPDKPL